MAWAGFGEARVGHLVAGADGVGDAVPEVLVEEVHRHALQGAGGRRDLGQHVDAVGVLVDHALQAPDLALDAAEALQHLVLGVVVPGVTVAGFAHAVTIIPPRGIV